jgi:hypothetical protein
VCLFSEIWEGVSVSEQERNFLSFYLERSASALTGVTAM